MSKNTIIFLGLVVVILVGWLVLVIAWDSSSSQLVSENDRPLSLTPSPDVTTGEQAVETSVEVESNNVKTSVTVVPE